MPKDPSPEEIARRGDEHTIRRLEADKANLARELEDQRNIAFEARAAADVLRAQLLQADEKSQAASRTIHDLESSLEAWRPLKEHNERLRLANESLRDERDKAVYDKNTALAKLRQIQRSQAGLAGSIG